MAKFINFLFTLAWFVYLLCAGIHLFSKGFLLSRVSQTEITECSHFDQLQCSGEPNCKTTQILKDINSSAKVCLPKKSKVIVVVIDALRHDFGTYNPDLKDPKPYQNRLKIMHDLLTHQPNHTRLMDFIADPPTTTLQRLKGMTTGSLPTFIDIGSNFASPEINEDNIIDQIHRHNLTSVFMGDNTWMELFPERFKRHYGYPSFNIQDLDTVDRAIEKQFPKEMNERDWDVIVAHFLGVDHCGHKHGPNHPEMSRKLDEMNEFITNVTRKMDDNTVLIVIGDHGMSSTGDHGGESHNEVTSMLFMHSKGNPFNSVDYAFDESSLQQIDLVPTLAAILGIPSPYSNLGIVNLHLIPETTVDDFLPYQTQMLHLWHNAQQIQHYFQKYAQLHRGTFEAHNLETLEHTYLILSHRVNSIYTEAAFQNFAKDVRVHLKEILQVCRTIWVKFDAQLMSQGMLITFISTFLIYVLVNNVGVWQLQRIFDDRVLGFVYLANSLVAIPSILFFKEFAMSNETHSILFFTSILSFLILGYLIIQNWPEIASSMSNTTRYGNVITRFVLAFSCTIFFSNSYLVQEQRILGYMLISLFIYFLFQVATTTTLARDLRTRFRWSVFFKSIAFKLVILTTVAVLMLRMSFHYFRCREEQENCVDNRMQPQRRSSSSYDLMPVIVMGMFATLSRIYLKSCGNLTGYGAHVMLTRYGPTLAAVCAGGHFVLTKSLNHDIKLLYIDALAWTIYGLFGLHLLFIAVNPLLIYVLPKRNDQVTINEYANVIPELYRKLKQNYGRNAPADEVPIVCGLATVYSSIYVALATIFGLLLCLLLGPQPAVGFVLIVAIAIAVIVMNSIIRYETSSTLERSLQPQFVTLVAWLLMVQFGFYATSHQPTMSQIDWNAAFVGRTMHFDHSMLLSAILVIFNTFCTSFYFGLLYPLMIIAPFCLYSIWPTLSAKMFKSQKLLDNKNDIQKTADNVEYRRMTVNKAGGDSDTGNGVKTATLLHVDFDVTRGEVNLFENETVFLLSAFKTGCQLLMLQGLRICCSMMASTVLCRHLMVWKIFAPRFIYEGISSYAIFISITLGYAILIRIHTSVCELVDKLNKSQ